jgi:S1-C subfamily serine protease
MRRPWISNLLLTALTVILIVGAFTSFERRRSSFERLDFQFHWDHGVIVVEGVDAGSGAERAGLRRGDQI